MRCEKCGAEWNGIVTTDNAKCPFCGDILSEDIPYKQVIDSLRMLVDRFGGEIYLESQRLDAMVNDLVPNALKEKILSGVQFHLIFQALFWMQAKTGKDEILFWNKLTMQ